MSRGRKTKVRYVQKMPVIAQFSPRGKAGRPDEVELRVDQFEAIKIADFQGYDQTEGAQLMGISRPSFGRILREGRAIVADAIVNGKIIRIRIGNVQVGVHRRNVPKKDALLATSVPSEQLQDEVIRDRILKHSYNNGELRQGAGKVVVPERARRTSD